MAGSNPGEAVGFFGRKVPYHAFLRIGSKAVCPMSQNCSILKTPGNYVEVEILRRNLLAISRPFLGRFSLSEFSHVA
jgi:hypothetical protein